MLKGPLQDLEKPLCYFTLLIRTNIAAKQSYKLKFKDLWNNLPDTLKWPGKWNLTFRKPFSEQFIVKDTSSLFKVIFIGMYVICGESHIVQRSLTYFHVLSCCMYVAHRNHMSSVIYVIITQG